MSDYRTFLVPYDFSAHSRAALFAAVDLAKRFEADLHLLHVIQPPTFAYGYGAYGGAVAPPPVDMADVRDAAIRSLADVASGVEGATGAVEPHVIEGHGVAARICELAEKIGADLIVMGTHGRTGLAHVFLGSVAERTLRSAPCPVLSVQAREEGAG